MLASLNRVIVGVMLLLLLSGLLLAWDSSRQSTARTGSERVAILQHASTPVLDDCIEGMVLGLAENGFREGTNLVITRFNAEGDLATATSIAQQLVQGDFDLVLTSSTPSLQVVAKANQAGKTNHVFGAVADPFSAGVGLDANDPLKHPPHLTGLGTLAPVRGSFEIAKRMLPSLRRVGVAHNPSESNSRVFLAMAREACRGLDLDLLEVPVENSAGVLEAVRALQSQGAQAIWVGGDNAVNAVLATVIQSARQGGIPVFTVLPGKPDRGTLFDVGVDFTEVGKLTGALAARILRGEDATKIPIRDVLQEVPKKVSVNLRALEGLKEAWSAPSDVLELTTAIVDQNGNINFKNDRK